MTTEQAAPLKLQALYTKAELDTEFGQVRGLFGSLLRDAPDMQGDYGLFFGAKRQSLLLPGAEKLARQYGLVPRYDLLDKQEDWEGGFVAYKVRCSLFRYGTGELVGEALGSANSRAKTFQGREGKTPPAIYELSDKVQARAAKRAFVHAVACALCVQSLLPLPGNQQQENTQRPQPPRPAAAPHEPPAAAAEFAQLTRDPARTPPTPIHRGATDAAEQTRGIMTAFTYLGWGPEKQAETLRAWHVNTVAELTPEDAGTLLSDLREQAKDRKRKAGRA